MWTSSTNSKDRVASRQSIELCVAPWKVSNCTYIRRARKPGNMPMHLIVAAWTKSYIVTIHRYRTCVHTKQTQVQVTHTLTKHSTSLNLTQPFTFNPGRDTRCRQHCRGRVLLSSTVVLNRVTRFKPLQTMRASSHRLCIRETNT